MPPQQRQTKAKSSPKTAQPAVPAAAATPPTPTAEDTGVWPQWMKTLVFGVKLLALFSAAAYATLGVRQVVVSNGDKYAELESRFSFSFAYALFKATVMYLTTLSLGWLTIYVVSDVFAKAAKADPVSIPFTVAMKDIIPFAMGGMWIGHAIRFGISLQELNMMWLRVWVVIVVMTNGPAMLLYVRTWSKANRNEMERKARVAARSRANAEAAQAAT